MSQTTEQCVVLLIVKRIKVYSVTTHIQILQFRLHQWWGLVWEREVLSHHGKVESQP